MANSSVILKLLIDTQAKRVLFAEAGKDCVDFLFCILSLPVAKLISLLGKQEMVGSVSNLYESVKNLNNSYIQPNQTKNTLLKPVSPVTGFSVPLCSYCIYKPSSHVSDDPLARCSKCGQMMSVLIQYVAQAESRDESGFVKGGVGGVVTYMVMDDLVVLPMSTVSTNTTLHKLDVKDVGVLEEKVVNLGMVEAVKLLKASLETNDVLTRVFMNGENSRTSNYCI
ncbi:hypothetical protein PHJA_000789200 [Phtheirospermum japonicum]|uniref:Uncharacterized protein n=1 Tax=Phtheirospermum japonicum TaxID=374723 RepID=A0A830BPI6_9LAMI|nr:hypothetical protein PHJA_000789200 [Phtheirospermum japonicum]